MSISPVLSVTETEPTLLLKDFTAFTRFLRTHRVVLTRINGFISGKDLYELNRVMTHPVPNTTPRTAQTLYPLLHLFYHLALTGKLVQKASGGGGKLVLKPTERLRLYEELKPAEKYFFLLETLWIDSDWQKLQAGYFGQSPLYTVPRVLEWLSQQQAEKKIRLKEGGGHAYAPSHVSSDWEYFLLYFSFFGFWQVTRDEDLYARDWPKHSFQADSITPSTFGVTIAPILNVARELPKWNLTSRRFHGEWKATPGSPLPAEDVYEIFGDFEKGLMPKKTGAVIKIDKGKPGDPFFLPFVPLFGEGELQKTLPREGIKFVDGTYVFKVALAKSLWRRIEVSADHTLLDLHRSIQRAYAFDDDHLYSFFMNGKPWSREKFTCPMDDEGPYVDEARIGELGLFVGQSILYLFDYGDDWRFRVELEDIRTEGPKPHRPKVVEGKEKAPEQYRYDEE